MVMYVPLNLFGGSVPFCHNDDTTNISIYSPLGFLNAIARMRNTDNEQTDVTVGDSDDALNGLRFNATTNWYIGQPFIPRYNVEYHKFDLYLSKTGNPAGNMQLKIREIVGGAATLGTPTGTLMGSSSLLLQDGIAAGPAYVSFSFGTPPYLEAGKMYAAVLEADTTNSVTDFVAWHYDQTAPPYISSAWLGSNVPVWNLNNTLEHVMLVKYKEFAAAAAEEVYVRLDSGSANTTWDMSTIIDVEDWGAMGYKYGTSNTAYDCDQAGPAPPGRSDIDTLIDTFTLAYLTYANLRLEVDPVGRYLYLKLQFNRSSATVGCRIAGAGLWIQATAVGSGTPGLLNGLIQ